VVASMGVIKSVEKEYFWDVLMSTARWGDSAVLRAYHQFGVFSWMEAEG